jgi:hypothetical protein
LIRQQRNDVLFSVRELLLLVKEEEKKKRNKGREKETKQNVTYVVL